MCGHAWHVVGLVSVAILAIKAAPSPFVTSVLTTKGEDLQLDWS